MRLEKGAYNPSLQLAMDISNVLNVPINELFKFE
ncbi:MAG: helix-turn-helix transcriptional regulator [Anaerotignum sp.]